MNVTSFLKKADLKSVRVTVDAANKKLVKVACEVAKVLRGKNNQYTPHMTRSLKVKVDVINVDQIELSGTKRKTKIYRKHTGFFGHLHETTFERLSAKKFDEPLKLAIRGMLGSSKNSFKNALIAKVNFHRGVILDTSEDARQKGEN